MATIKMCTVIKSVPHLQRSVSYIMRLDKTMNGQLISGLNVLAFSPTDVIETFMDTKKRFGKEDQRLAYHWEQSFKPGELEPELAFQIGKEFAERVFPDYEVVITTHVDKGHIHNHFILNSVSLVTGLKYHEPDSLYYEYQKINDEICLKYGLSIVREEEKKNKRRSPSFSETHPEEAHSITVHSFLYEDFDRAVEAAESLEDFFRILREEMGYRVKRGENVAHTAVAPQGHGFFRLYKFMKGYTEEDVARRIEAKTQGRKLPGEDLLKQRASPAATGGKGEGAAYKRPREVSRVQLRIRYSRYYVRRYHRRSLRETYLQYRFALKKVSRGTYPKYPSFELRRELQKLEQYSQETMLLVTHGIDDLGQLDAYKAELDQKVPEIYGEIGRLNSRLKRSRKVPLSDRQREELKERIDSLKKDAAPLVREQHLCMDIAQRSQYVAAAVDREKESSVRELERQREREAEIER